MGPDEGVAAGCRVRVSWRGVAGRKAELVDGGVERGAPLTIRSMTEMSGPDSTLPFLEPSFEFLVATLRMQAEMNLGLMPMPGEDKPAPPNLMMARHFIDLLAMLVEKTKGNLSVQEARMIENSVTELRFRFVMASENAAKAGGGSVDAEGGAGSAAAGSQ